MTRSEHDKLLGESVAKLEEAASLLKRAEEELSPSRPASLATSLTCPET